MAPVRNKKRTSGQSTTDAMVPIKNPSTPERSPIKKRKLGISVQQKQALIENLQLEVTERARRLRAQYQLQAQGLRSRIEIRINRIPMALRKLKMGDLVLKYSQQGHGQQRTSRPPVPAKDSPRCSPQRTLAPRTQAASRGYKRTSNEISGNKENDVENMDGKKRPRAAPGTDAARVRPNQILSPTSSNSRLANRDRPASPIKSALARPGSPLKSSGASRSAAATSVLSSMVERAKATRNRGTRKVTTTSDTSSTSDGTVAAARTRRTAATAAAKPPASRPATRTGRRISANSETSEGSNGTVIRKASAAPKTAPSTTRTGVIGTIRKGVAGAGTRKATTTTRAAAAPATTAASGRVLRKRG